MFAVQVRYCIKIMKIICFSNFKTNSIEIIVSITKVKKCQHLRLQACKLAF